MATKNKNAIVALIVLWAIISVWMLYSWVERNEARRNLATKKAAVEIQIQMIDQEMRAIRNEGGSTGKRYRREQTLHEALVRLYESIDNERMADLHRTFANDSRVSAHKMDEIESRHR